MTTPPERIHGWQDSQLSIARFYGGITYQGHTYTIAVAEKGAPLVRSDVLAREADLKDKSWTRNNQRRCALLRC